MPAPNQLQFIRRVMYRMKRRYGAKIEYYRTGDLTVDETTGIATGSRTKLTLNKVVRLPDVNIRETMPLPRGVTREVRYDRSERDFVIDVKDLPSGFIPEVEDYLIMDGRRYNVKEVVEWDFRQGYFITAFSTEGQELEQIFEMSVKTSLGFHQEVTYVIN